MKYHGAGMGIINLKIGFDQIKCKGIEARQNPSRTEEEGL
jgi:hypothetical protein